MAACKEKARNNMADKFIDVTEISSDNFSMTDIIDSSYFIPLEANDESLIKAIDKIVFDYDKIFVLDKQGNNKILVFDRQGKFVSSIGKIGKGPGEYIEISDFCLDTQDKMIYLLCERRRLMLYNYNGDFVEQKNVDFHAAKMEYSNEHFYFIGDQQDFFNLLVTDINFKIIDKFFSDKDWGSNTRLLIHPLQKMDSLVYYFRFLDDNIYEIKNHSKVFVKYGMDFGKTKIDFSKVKDYTKSGLKDRLSMSRGRIKYWIQNSDYSICYCFDKNIPVMNIYDKEKDISRSYFVKNVHDQYTVDVCLFEYLTDINELVAVVQPTDLLQNIESIKNEEDKNYMKSMGLDEDMNPLLYVVKTKQVSKNKN
jgi:hypothetical protein